uniref:Glycine-rich peptide n=1 Tax=Scytodes thoracica TaxID=1112478 RepID=A0A0A0V5G5_SCYTH|nr:glycine-rich peptide [Scytodes thoracica]
MWSLTFSLILMACTIAMVMAAPKPFFNLLSPLDGLLGGIDSVAHAGAQVLGLEPQQQYRQRGGYNY